MGGCVHPGHLEWKTPSENQLDRAKHGTAVTSRYGPVGKLTKLQRQEIIDLKGKMPQREIAKLYGVHFETVSRWQRIGKTTMSKFS
jgi:DNA invertase Pin-like site-specific DNA recombinase